MEPSISDELYEGSPRWDYMHSCGKPAFYSVAKISFGSKRSSESIRHLDGSPVKTCEPVICDSCGEKIGLLSSANFKRIKCE